MAHAHAKLWLIDELIDNDDFFEGEVEHWLEIDPAYYAVNGEIRPIAEPIRRTVITDDEIPY